ncbi:hypothetical protein KY285_029728 [Solanum tuberosum]|nr:hypothetical protein KY284_029682 [Solanum tuberosum]KAH0652220.1 hypothetical protein KY289_029898 [Solanum tuberosum]KAH0654846.1 hypothetical protein KY285_029728 [Solanum tuberosum]
MVFGAQIPMEIFNKVVEIQKYVIGTKWASRLDSEIGDLLQSHLINSNGIVPCDSATYNNVEILNSFKQVSNNKDVSFTCKDINATHSYLNQVTFCYTNDAKNFVDCPTSVTNKRCRVQNIIVPRPSPPKPIKQQEKSLDPIAYGDPWTIM